MLYELVKAFKFCSLPTRQASSNAARGRNNCVSERIASQSSAFEARQHFVHVARQGLLEIQLLIGRRMTEAELHRV